MNQTITTKVTYDALKRVIRTISPLDVLLLYLKIEKNLTLREIEERVCMSYETIRKRLHAVYDMIRKELEDENVY